MKPILTFSEGVIKPFDSQRTHKRALARLKEVVLENCPKNSGALLSIMHGDSEDIAQQCAEELSSLLAIPLSEIPIYDLTPAILVHSGPGVIAISFFVNSGK
jgi:fatty acid-binding protein DegV